MATAALIAAALGGCGSTLEQLPIVGEPADTPQAAHEAPAYLAVHDMPPARSVPVLATEDQARLQNDLIAARDKQSANAKAEADRDAQESQAAQRSAAKSATTATKTASKATSKVTSKTTKQAQSGSTAKTQADPQPNAGQQ